MEKISSVNLSRRQIHFPRYDAMRYRELYNQKVPHVATLKKDGDLEHALALMASLGAIAATLKRAREFSDAARNALSVFPDTEIRRILAGIAAYTVSRNR